MSPGAAGARGVWKCSLDDGCIICDNWAFLHYSVCVCVGGGKISLWGSHVPQPGWSSQYQAWGQWVCWGAHRKQGKPTVACTPLEATAFMQDEVESLRHWGRGSLLRPRY